MSAPQTGESSPAGPLVRVRGLAKSFAGVEVLHGVDLDLECGEVHALLGENGAGKSTFAKLLAGVHRPSRGSIEIGGREVQLPDPLAARRAGVTLIHQEPVSFPDLSVAENLAIGRDGGWLSRFRWADANAEAERLMSLLAVSIDVRKPMRGLSIADQQMVEIARALAEDSRLIIMDEPTAALTAQESATLFKIVRRLRAEGRTIVYISHRLEEVRELCDRATVFRDGEKVATAPMAQLGEADIIQLMIGRPLKEFFRRADAQIGAVALAVRQLNVPGRVVDVSLEVRRGEVLGMAGLVGAGRTDVASAIFGLRPDASGSISVDGREVAIRSPSEAVACGIGFVPEDRAVAGIFATLPVESNISVAVPRQIAPRGAIDRAKERELVDGMTGRLHIKLASQSQPIGELSGGNQQKAILARWLLTRPQILILDEPTRGIDIGVKAEFYDIIGELAAAGCAILLISSELPELLALSDRVVVMCEGRVTAQLTREQATADAIMMAAVPRSQQPGQSVEQGA